MNTRRALILFACSAWIACASTALAMPGGASGFSSSASGAFSPQVPVSAFARPASWLDLSRLHITTSLSMGTGFGGGTSALQVTSLAYQFGSPLSMQVSLGNTFGAGSPGSSMFLEGFSVAYRPHPSFQINVDYRNVRSPLQYQNPYNPFGTYSPYGR
jgi:hypothetical protein